MLRVRRPNESIIPKVIPRGFRLPPVVVEDKIIGRNGQIQGANIVINPEIKAKRRRTDIYKVENLAADNSISPPVEELCVKLDENEILQLVFLLKVLLKQCLILHPYGLQR